jgi:hypothetical protein
MGLDTTTNWLTDRKWQCNFDFVESFESRSCYKWEFGSWGTGIFGNREEAERLPLETATKQLLVKTEKTLYML